MNLFGNLVDWGGSAAARMALNKWLKSRKLEESIMIKELTMAFKEGRLVVVLTLEGEPAPVEVQATGMTIRDEGDATYLDIAEATVSKPWMNALVRQFGGFPRAIRVPEKYASLVKTFLK